MAKFNNNSYVKLIDKNGNEYLCPIDAVKSRDAVSDQELDDCVENDVVGRYAGNIEIESH